MYNKVILLGYVTRNPDVRTLTNSTTTIATTGLAVHHKYKDKDEVMFIDIVVYGKQAELMGEYVIKGTPILVEGRLSFRQWEQDGIKRSKHEVIVESFRITSSKKDNTLETDDSTNFIKDEDVPLFVHRLVSWE